MTSTVCSSCGTDYASARGVVFVVTVRRRGDFQACPRCHADYQRQCAANRADEDRERAEAQARAKRAEQKNERKRSA